MIYNEMILKMKVYSLNSHLSVDEYKNRRVISG